VGIQPLDFCAEAPDHFDHVKNIRQLGNIAEYAGLFGQQRRRYQR
jgi:hypothetical protein